MKLTTHFHVVPSLRMRGVIPPLPYMSSCRGAYLSMRYIFMAWYLVKHRESFTFYLYTLFEDKFRDNV